MLIKLDLCAAEDSTNQLPPFLRPGKWPTKPDEEEAKEEQAERDRQRREGEKPAQGMMHTTLLCCSIV